MIVVTIFVKDLTNVMSVGDIPKIFFAYIALLTAKRTYSGYYILNPVTLDLITHMNEM